MVRWHRALASVIDPSRNNHPLLDLNVEHCVIPHALLSEAEHELDMAGPNNSDHVKPYEVPQLRRRFCIAKRQSFNVRLGLVRRIRMGGVGGESTPIVVYIIVE